MTHIEWLYFALILGSGVEALPNSKYYMRLAGGIFGSRKMRQVIDSGDSEHRHQVTAKRGRVHHSSS